jgi:hypothetical protein
MADESVLSAIRALPWSELTEAVYQVLLVLRQRSFLDHNGISAMLDGATSSNSTDPDGKLRKIVESTIQAIESAENKHLGDISESEISEYRQMFSDLLSENIQANLANSGVSGAELLRHLGA